MFRPLLTVALFIAQAAAPFASCPAWAQEPPAQLPGDTLERVEPALRERMRLYDAERDDWDLEVFQERAGSALKELAHAWMEGDESNLAERIAPLLDPGFELHDQLFPKLLAISSDGGLTAAVGGLQASAESAPSLAAALTAASPTQPLQIKSKFHRVDGHEDGVRTEVRIQIVDLIDGRMRERHLTWDVDWSWPHRDAAPLLRSISTVSIGGAFGRDGGDPLFEDLSRAQFVDTELYDQLLRPGLMDWKRRIAASIGISDRSQHGFAVGDVDGDGLEDLYLPQPAGLPNLLLRRRADGRLEDIAAWAGVDFLDSTRTGLLVDLDNDGDLDLVTNLAATIAFLENDGSGRFTLRTSGNAPESTMLTAADYDGDGFLDIYACRYLNPYENQGVPLPYHDAENGYPNVLLDHDGAWTVRDVTDEVGLGENNTRFSFAAAWEDYDNDGDLDLYVANDFGRNNLYRNDGGHFVDVAAEAGVEDISAGMGVSWADYDGDGWMDLLVSNMYSSAGNRVTYQREFQSAADGTDLSGFRRHARGNSLFRNLGDGSFEDRSVQEGVTMGRWAWGSIFFDVGNNGRPDIFVPNGFMTGGRPDDL
jgi:hypothetical protein